MLDKIEHGKASCSETGMAREYPPEASQLGRRRIAARREKTTSAQQSPCKNQT